MSVAKPVGGRIITPIFVLCLLFIVIAGFFLVKRFVFGLGAVTNMSDGFPWGIWIAYDVVVGSAFACGGYVMALMCYVLNKGEYHPLVRPALLASMFGYTLAGVSVFFDIGRYAHAYNLFLPWQMNVHSVMFEVAMCITAYIFVLWLEFTPAFLEKWNKEKLNKMLSKVIFLLIALGVLLPTMHQSSLGTMMVLAGYKLDPMWQTALLPLLFLATALFMGFAMVVFEGTISSREYHLGDETHMFTRIARILVWIIGIFLIIRFHNLLVSGELGAVFSGTFLGNMFLLENLLLLSGMVIMAYKKLRSCPRMLFLAAIVILLGGALYRFNVYLIAFNPGGGWTYFPSIGEQMVTYALIAVEIAAYTFFVKYFPVFEGPKPAKLNS